MPLNTDIDAYFISLGLRKPCHRVAPSLLWGCSKDVPSFYQHKEWDERNTENINKNKDLASTMYLMRAIKKVDRTMSVHLVIVVTCLGIIPDAQ